MKFWKIRDTFFFFMECRHKELGGKWQQEILNPLRDQMSKILLLSHSHRKWEKKELLDTVARSPQATP